MRTLSMAAVAIAASASATPVAAATMYFDYDGRFFSKVAPITTAISRAVPYVDKLAATGGLDGPMTMSLSGSYDTDKIVATSSGMSVRLEIKSAWSSIYATTFADELTLVIGPDGQFSFDFALQPVFCYSECSKPRISFQPTTISGVGRQSTGLSTNVLTDGGDLTIVRGAFDNLYGTSIALGSPDYYLYNYGQYLDHGVNVANGRSLPIAGAAVPAGRLTIFGSFSGSSPGGADPVTPSVPEPATWAMMLVGFGMVAATARYRRRKTNFVIA